MLINYIRSESSIRNQSRNPLSTGVFICCFALFYCISEGLCEVRGYANEYPQLWFRGKDGRSGCQITYCPYCRAKLNPEED